MKGKYNMAIELVNGQLQDVKEQKIQEILKDMSDTINMQTQIDEIKGDHVEKQIQSMQRGGEINTQFKQSSSKQTTRKSFKRVYKIGTRP
tara:strand:- start:9 stop:278 length:270 start_codon:yes stop_codon:yes gene_type:complete